MTTRDTRLLSGFLLSLIALSAFSLPWGASQLVRQPSILRRIIKLEEYGLVSYNDTFMISKYDFDRTEGVSSFTFTIPETYARRMVALPKPFTFSGDGSSNADLFVISNATGALVIKVSRAPLLNLMKGNYINFSMAYRLIVVPEQIASQLRNLTFPLKFSTDLPVHFFLPNITVPAGKLWAIPGQFEKEDKPEQTVLYMPFAMEENQQFSVISVILSSYITSFSVTSIYKTITFDPLLGLSVEEGFSVRSDPRNPQGIIPPVFITNQASDVWARDLIGPITSQVSAAENGTLKAVSVEPRISLRGGGNYTFFVDYKLPASNFTTRDGDRVTIKLPASPNYTLLVDTYVLTVNLPTGAKIEGVRLGQAEVQNLEHPSSNTVRASISNLPLDVLSQSLAVTMNYALLWAGYTPAALVFIMGAVVLGAYYTVLRKPSGPERPEAEPSLKLAAEVSHAIKKSIALFSQTQELEMRYFEGDINRREFKGLHQKLRSDLERALSEIHDATRRLTGVSSRYASRLRNYEALWAELQAKHASLREVGFGYLNKKISRATYAELSERYSRETSDTVSKIRTLLDEFPAS